MEIPTIAEGSHPETAFDREPLAMLSLPTNWQARLRKYWPLVLVTGNRLKPVSNEPKTGDYKRGSSRLSAAPENSNSR